jgi:hypothetical protein
MPISVAWDEQAPNIVLHHMSGVWSLDEYFASIDEVARLCQSVAPARADCVSTLEVGSRPPAGANFLAAARSALNRSAPNMHMLVLCGNVTSFARTIMNMMIYVLKLRIEVVLAADVTQARQVILKHCDQHALPSN